MHIMNKKKQLNPSLPSLSFRASPQTVQMLRNIANDERRSMSGVIVYIVDQYLASTNGQLLKRAKVVSEDGQEAA